MKAVKIDFTKLRNEEHYQFQKEFVALVNSYGAKALNIQRQFETYVGLFNQENLALQAIRKNASTELLADADAERDSLLRGFVDTITSNNNHFNETKRASALKLTSILNQYSNIERKPYDEETLSLAKLIQELKSTYASDVDALAVNDWVAEIDNTNTIFNSLLEGHYSEQAIKTDLQMKQVRQSIDTSFQVITARIDALFIVKGPTAYLPFLRDLHTRINKYNNIISLRKGRLNVADETSTSTGNALPSGYRKLLKLSEQHTIAHSAAS